MRSFNVCTLPAAAAVADDGDETRVECVMNARPALHARLKSMGVD